MEQDNRKTVVEHAWNYFSLHANQRMSVFNFYLILVGLLTTGVVKTFEKDFPLPSLGCLLGFLLFFVSVVFWRMDKRTSFLINRAEDALKILESSLEGGESKPELRIFTREAEMTTELKQTSCGMVTYGQCLRAVFLIFAIVGLIAVVAAYVRSV